MYDLLHAESKSWKPEAGSNHGLCACSSLYTMYSYLHVPLVCSMLQYWFPVYPDTERHCWLADLGARLVSGVQSCLVLLIHASIPCSIA